MYQNTKSYTTYWVSKSLKDCCLFVKLPIFQQENKGIISLFSSDITACGYLQTVTRL